MSNKTGTQSFATRCIHAGNTTDSATGAVMPPIVTSSTYVHPAFGEAPEYIYSRTANPTCEALERCVAELESGVKALAYSSGMAATAAVLELLDSCSHVIAPAGMYGGTLRLFSEVRSRSAGHEFSFVDFSDPENVAAATRPDTRLIWVETPTNPLLQIIDLEAVVSLAKSSGGDKNILVAVDNTFASPCLQRPLELGCDIVMHSTTKYLGGHCDVIGGMNIVADHELAARMQSLRTATGGIASPFDAYLVLRGVKTLALRMERQVANAGAIAAWLQNHAGTSVVHYPGLESHAQHDLAVRQMDGFGAVVSFVLVGDVARFMNQLSVFSVAESLGGVESLAGHPATMSHSGLTPEQRSAIGIEDNLIRLSIGIEDADDLIADLEQALAENC